MLFDKAEGKARPDGFLTRLARDRRGNTMVIMAMALIPVAGFAGSAVDMGRLYVVRVRLQQACDAGALAGRRTAVDDSDPALDAAAVTTANKFFDNNFQRGWMNTRNIQRTFQGTPTFQVTGTAQTDVPMAIMGMFSAPRRTIKVMCSARLDIPDVDVMLVLDTTGSMACPPGGPSSCGQTTITYTRSAQAGGGTGYALTEASGSRIGSLRKSVLEFYKAMETYSDARTNVRYGIVPYSSTVNVGFQLPANFIADKHVYASRRPIEDSDYGDLRTEVTERVDRATCEGMARRYPLEPLKYETNGEAVVRKFVGWANAKQGTCTLSAQTVVPKWRFDSEREADTSQFKIKGKEVEDPSKYDRSQNRWQGCIEERQTSPLTSFSPASLPADLDPDLQPTSDATKWKPMWPEQIYDRLGVSRFGKDIPDNYFAPKKNPSDLTDWYRNYWAEAEVLKAGYAPCGAPVQRLAKMTKSQLEAYLNAPEFRPFGPTYHDAGMIWGTRLLSPTGPFAGDTAPWPARGQPNRHLIFMTDGEMAPNNYIYGMYGLERWDGRVGGANADNVELAKRHNARFRAVCEAAKASPRNITVWVIAFSEKLNSDLAGCASSASHAFETKTGDGLDDAFRRIAKKIAALRVYQ